MIEFEIILFANDLQKSKKFYRDVLLKEPVQDDPVMVEFLLAQNVKLGLTSKKHDSIHSCELHLKVDKVSEFYDRAIKAGGESVESPIERNWDTDLMYAKDPDGHIIAFANSL